MAGRRVISMLIQGSKAIRSKIGATSMTPKAKSLSKTQFQTRDSTEDPPFSFSLDLLFVSPFPCLSLLLPCRKGMNPSLTRSLV